LTGIAITDQARMFALAEMALDFCREWLKPGGDFVIKVFQGSGYEEYVKAMRELFTKVSVEKPDASRSESGELYLLGKSKKSG
jgi:23S rRNA (uridine2552-2'-O)-methyltransferase